MWGIEAKGKAEFKCKQRLNQSSVNVTTNNPEVIVITEAIKISIHFIKIAIPTEYLISEVALRFQSTLAIEADSAAVQIAYLTLIQNHGLHLYRILLQQTKITLTHPNITINQVQNLRN